MLVQPVLEQGRQHTGCELCTVWAQALSIKLDSHVALRKEVHYIYNGFPSADQNIILY